MTVWNTAMPVIAGVEAETAEEAIAKLRAALERAGFTCYDGSAGPSAFEDREGMADHLPQLRPGTGRVVCQNAYTARKQASLPAGLERDFHCNQGTCRVAVRVHG